MLPELCKETSEKLAAIKAELKEEAVDQAEERREPSVEVRWTEKVWRA